MMELSISEARARLPELAQRAMDSPEPRIYIRHRDRKERLVLTTESHIEMLEAMVMNLRKRLGRPSFRLEGSAATELSADDLAAAIAAGRLSEQAASTRRERELE
jgi:hypothetical protein